MTAQVLEVPEDLPADIGSRPYVVIGNVGFLPADEVDAETFTKLGLDERRAKALVTEAKDTHHFLFGTPGVRASGGRFLYHYTSFEKLELIRQSRSLRLSPNHTKNDPMESRNWTGLGMMTGVLELGKSPSPQVNERANEHMKAMDELRLQTLAVSFGTDKLREGKYGGIDLVLGGATNPSMWAHYGDGHKGACIVIDRHRFDFAAETALAAEGVAFSGLVRYSDSLEDLIELGGYYVEGETGSPAETLIERRESHFLTKAPAWSNEAEYRWVCIPTSGAEEAFVPLEEAVVGVLIGDQANANDARLDAFVRDFRICFNVARCSWRSPFNSSPEMVRDFVEVAD